MSGKLGRCYETAGRMFQDIDMGLESPFPEGIGPVRLVHGQPTLTVEPFAVYGHAWLEAGPLVFDTEKQALIPKALYYRIGQIDEDSCFYYDRTKFRRMCLDHGHWGPWEGPEADE